MPQMLIIFGGDLVLPYTFSQVIYHLYVPKQVRELLLQLLLY